MSFTNNQFEVYRTTHSSNNSFGRLSSCIDNFVRLLFSILVGHLVLSNHILFNIDHIYVKKGAEGIPNAINF